MQTEVESQSRGRRLRADAVLVGVAVVWGTDFVMVKNLLGAVPALPFLFWRFSLAALCGLLVLRRARRTPGVWADGARLGILAVLGMGLQILGQVRTTASNASFLTGLASVLTPLAAFLLTRRWPTFENAVGLALAGSGFVLMTFPAGGGPVNAGDLLIFISAFVWAFYIVELAERSPRHDAAWLSIIQIAMVALAAGGASLARGGAPALRAGIAPILERPGWIAQVVFLAAVGTTGTFLFQTWAQGQMSATHAAIIFTLEPVVTALTAAAFLGERLGARGWTGGFLVLAGIVVSELRLRRPTTH
jgi:drug/metabolite transporter (DMT)-like permease